MTRSFRLALPLLVAIVACDGNGSNDTTSSTGPVACDPPPAGDSSSTTPADPGTTSSPDPSSSSSSSGSGSGESSTGDGVPEDPPTTLRVVSYNIKHAELSDLATVGGVLHALAPDIVALQEIDEDVPRSGNVLQSLRLGQLTGMASLFRAAIPLGGGDYGLAVLSRFPIVSSERIELTSADEQRILAIVRVQLDDGTVLPVAVTHMGLTDGERTTQAGEIVDALADEPHAVLMGDFNALPNSDALGVLRGLLRDGWTEAGDGEGFTFPAGDPDRRIDYVMLGSGWPTATHAEVATSEASDHRAVVLDVPIPR